MITSFEVGALFKIIDEASPTLRRILAQVRELNRAIESAKLNLASFAKMPALTAAIDETKLLATAWKDVAKSSAAANRAMGRAAGRTNALAGPGMAGVAEAQALANAWERIAAASAATAGSGRRLASAAGGGGGGASVAAAARGRRLAHGGGSGAHIGGPSVAIPGGSHVNFRGGAAAALGLAGYGAYEAAQMEDAVFQLIYHSGTEQNDENRARFRKILQDSMAESGYSLHDVAESAKQEIRMFQGTPGGGIDVLPEMLRASTIEARLKGESPEESMKALIGLAHMTKQYDPAAIKKLAPAFAFLSTANPGSLGSIEKAAGYAVPLLQSGLEIDPVQSLLLGTALTRAGATSTKSGTWLREMALRAMPGTSLMSKMAFKKHEEALKAFGLVDDKDKPTWFTDGKPDLLKMLDIAGSKAASIPVEKRAAYERALFGAQGGGGFALLADPAVREQVQALQKDMNSPDFKNRYAAFTEAYKQGSTVQNARTAIAEFNNTMMDIGARVLPAVNSALNDFKKVLESIRDMLPKAPGSGASVGARAIEGAAVGAAVGSVVPGVGTVAGGVGGGVLGTAAGFIEQYNDRFKLGFDKGGTYTSPGKTGKPAEKIEIKPQNIQLNLNLDGRTLAQTLAEAFYTFGMQAPAADGLGQYYSGDHNFPSK